MSIVLTESNTAGVLEDYDDLLEAIPAWANRNDLDSRLPQFVRMFEARANRLLRVKEMEASFASTALIDGAADLPAGFLAFKELRCDTSSPYTLQPRPLEWIRNQPESASPTAYFAVTGSQVVCWPKSGSIVGTYYSPLPALASNGTNWLLTNYPDFYLFGTLEQVGIYIRDANLIDLAGARAGQMLEEIRGSSAADALNGGPLTVMVR